MYYRYVTNLQLSLLFLLFFCLSQNSFAQYSIEGKVVNEADGSPLAAIDIHDNISNQVVSTDEQGVFRLNNLAAGVHELTIFSVSYNTLLEQVDLQKDTSLSVALSKLSVDLSAVEVFARKEELFALKQLKDVQGTSIYAGKKTEVVLMDLVAGNLATNVSRQIYAQVAGLNIYEGSDGGLQLGIGGRGLDPNRTSNFNTRQNGYDISADVLGYPENYYTPPTEAISEIQIIRGASSLQYGTQFGGLINFKLRKIPAYKKVQINTNQTIGSFGLFNSFNNIGLNYKRLSVNAYYNYKRGDGYRSNSDFESNNLFLGLGYALTNRTKLSAEFTYFKYLAKQAGGLTDQQFAQDHQQSTRSRNWFDVDWKLYNFKLEHQFNEQAELSVSIFGLDASRSSVGFRGNPINLNENPITALDEQDEAGNYILPRDLILGEFKNYGAEAKFLNRYKLRNRKAVFLIGSKYYKSNNSSIQGPGSLGVDADFNLYADQFPDYPSQSDFKFPNLNFSLFSENIFYLNERLSITPGIRFEYIKTKADGIYNQVIFDNAGNPINNQERTEYRELDRNFVLLGLGLEYKKSKSLNLYANLSQNYRSVTFSDIRVVSPTFIVDPDIKDEQGFTADFGIRGRKDKQISYDLGIYSVLYDDRIGIILDDRANRVRKNIGKAFIAGFESLVDFNLIRLLGSEQSDFKLNYFINAAFTYSEYLSSEEQNVVGKKVEFIPSVNLKSGLKFAYKNWMSSFQISYLSEQYTDVQNSAIASPGDIRNGVIGEIPAYHIADFSLSYNWKQFSIKGGINNVFDRAYFTRRATGYPGPGIIPSDGRSFYLTLAYSY